MFDNWVVSFPENTGYFDGLRDRVAILMRQAYSVWYLKESLSLVS